MFNIAFIVFFAVPVVIFLIGAVVLHSLHLLLGAFILAVVSAVFYAVGKNAQKNRAKKEEA